LQHEFRQHVGGLLGSALSRQNIELCQAIDPDGAAQSLAKARILAQTGDEAGCMSQVNQAKSQLGQQ